LNQPFYSETVTLKIFSKNQSTKMKNFGLRQRILKNELTIGSWVTIDINLLLKLWQVQVLTG